MIIRARKAKRQFRSSKTLVEDTTSTALSAGLSLESNTTPLASLSNATTGSGAKPEFSPAQRPVKAKVVLKESDNCFTPPDLVDPTEESFGRISLDPCWHPKSSVRPLRHFNIRKGQDGLKRDWIGAVVFVNPPWSQAKKWLERAHDQWRKGNARVVICLVPAKTDTEFFHTVLAKDADVYFLKGRPRFHKVRGKPEGTAQSTMMVIFGATKEQIERFAERVAGSWWLPDRPRSARPAAATFGPHRLVHDYGTACCTSHGFAGLVACGPSASGSADRMSPTP